MYSIYFEYLNIEQPPYQIDRNLTLNELLHEIAYVKEYESINDIKIIKIKKI